ncbi:MAG TPA: right-handed parallel beta-helix repeat-containing protein [Thermoanaerobaculia bacterium]
MVRPISPELDRAEQQIGAKTDGGIDGDVVRVTTLAADGPGSLRHALQTRGPRLVVFEVAGVIDLGGRTLTIREPHLTLAGQTAPDPGITLIRGGLIVETHDVVIQHIAVRPGDEGLPGVEWTPDALGVRRGSNGPVHDVIFDHCSATWAVDENLSTSGPGDVEDGSLTAHDITLRHCLIAEALSKSTHPKGEHSKGTLVHDGVRNVAIIGCVYAHNHERNPRVKGGATATVLDSVMYNWVSACVGIGAKGNQKMLTPAEVTLAGNVAIAGPNTRGKYFVKSLDPGARAFLRDNLLFGVASHDDGVIASEAAVAARDPRESAERALRSAGSRPARRDPIDARIVRSIIDGDGRIIDSQREAGGYPKRESVSRPVIVPQDRRQWLEQLSRTLEVDASVDVQALWTRFSAPSPDSQK